MTPKEVLAMCRQKDVKAVDLRFTDLLGTWQHFTIPAEKLTEDVFEDGFGFDGSSLRGWQGVHESDLLAVPQSETARLDPFVEWTTLSLICNVRDPITVADYPRDPRWIARKATTFLQSTGIADTAYFGPEAEFFVFDEVRFDQNEHEAFFSIDCAEAEWNRGRGESPNGSGEPGRNLGYHHRLKQGYFPVPPADQLMELRNEMARCMIDCGLNVECHHHEVGSAGQCEIDIKYGEMVPMADAIMSFKYIVKNVARRWGKTATFMPKPIYGDNGSGMHTHVSLWKENRPLFAGTGYAGLSELAIHAIGGILRHAPALLAFTNPTTNSYKRLVPGYEAPVHLTYSQRNRSAACRIPMYSSHPKAKRVEFRCPDPTCNPYLSFAAILMAMIDGIQNKLHPGEPLDCNLFDGVPREVPSTPSSLAASLAALQDDHEFLLRGDVFTDDVIQTWVNHKSEQEIAPLDQRPHPWEFCLYYDA